MPFEHRARLEKTLNHEKPDRLPVSLWHHFPVDDQNPESLAAATIAFQNRYDFDLVKIMPPSSFCLKDWGIQDKWRGNPEGTRDYGERVIKTPEDWFRLKPLDPQKGWLGKQLHCLKRLKKAFHDQTPYIQTIFNPLSQVKNLVGPEHVATHIRKYPEALHAGLKTILESTLRFIEAAKSIGMDGIFFAIQHATFQILTEHEYQMFGQAYDLPILNAVSDLWLNMAHIHGDDIMFDLICKYPVQILNWHDRDTEPGLSQALGKFNGVLCGGLSRIESLALGNPEKILKEAHDAYRQTNGKRLILGTGCVVPITTPYGNMMAARRSVERLG